MKQEIEIAQGQDFIIELLVWAGDGHGNPVTLRLTADAALGAGELLIHRDHPALALSDKLKLGEDGLVVNVAQTCPAGAETLTVSAIAAPLKSGDVLFKLQDLTGYTMELEVLTNAGDADPLLVLDDDDVTLADQTAAERGKVQFAGSAAESAALGPGAYYAAAWRRNTGSSRPLAEATIRLKDAGFQS